MESCAGPQSHCRATPPAARAPPLRCFNSFIRSLFSPTFHCLYYLLFFFSTKGKRKKRKSLYHNSVSGSYHFQTLLSPPFQLSLLSGEFSFIKIKPHFRLIFFSLSPFLQIEWNVISINLTSPPLPLAFITKPSSP